MLGSHNVQILLIGPAGENSSLVASVMNNLSRAAARGGVAAVMGSKNLKAVAVKGSGGTYVRDREEILSLLKEIQAGPGQADPWFHMFSHAGTHGV